MSKIKLAFCSILLLSLSSCFTNGLVSSAVDKARFKEVPDGYNFDIYTNNAEINISVSALSTEPPEILTPNYRFSFDNYIEGAKQTAEQYNFSINNTQSTNCLLAITSISIEEQADLECEENKDGENRCFTINGIDVTMEGILLLNGMEHQVEANAWDKTKIKTALIGGDLKESAQSNLDGAVTQRAFDKLIGKCTKAVNGK